MEVKQFSTFTRFKINKYFGCQIDSDYVFKSLTIKGVYRPERNV